MLGNLLQPEVQQYIRDHEQADISQLLLKGESICGVSARELAIQISGRVKAKKKLPEWCQKKGIVYPAKISVEQCSSEQTAQYKSSIVRGEKMADLTGGMGVDTYGFSKKYRQVTYIEQDAELFEVSAHNFGVLGADNIKLENTSAEEFLEKTTSTFDLIYLDPARRNDDQKKVFRLEDCTPDVVLLLPALLRKAKHLMIKTAPFLDIVQALRQLGHVREVYIIAVNNECKEVLYLLSREAPVDHRITAHCVNLNENKPPQVFMFELGDEAKAIIKYSLPNKYIYEPNTAILKSGGINSVGNAFGLNKLHPNSQLFSSDKLAWDFPGRIFECIGVLKYDKKIIRNVVSSGKANITVRNFPHSVANIRKKTGLKEGGDEYLFATTNMNNEKVVLRTKKLDHPMG